MRPVAALLLAVYLAASAAAQGFLPQPLGPAADGPATARPLLDRSLYGPALPPADAPPRPGIPADATAVILADLAAHPQDAFAFRYVWHNRPTPLRIAAGRYTATAVMNRSGALVNYPILGGTVMRIDLRLLGPKLAQFEYLRDTWERLSQLEPYFLVNGPTVDVRRAIGKLIVTAETAAVELPGRVLARPRRGTRFDILGEETTARGTRWFLVQAGNEQGFIRASNVRLETEVDGKRLKARTVGPHCGAEMADIVLATGSTVPVVRYDWWVRVMWSSLEQGLYPEFRGIGKAPEGSGLADHEHFLLTFTGITEAELDKIRTAMQNPRNKTLIAISEVTKKPRMVIIFSSPAAHLTVNQGLVAITQDMANHDVDAFADPVRNLKTHKSAALEIFIEQQDGTVVTGLFTGDLNGDGKYDRNVTRQFELASGLTVTLREGEFTRAAPDFVVSDWTVPNGHTQNLQNGISCIRCHSGRHQGTGMLADGWMPLRNDAQAMLNGEEGLDVFGERKTGFPLRDDIAELAALFQGDMAKPVARARDDLAETMTRLTGITENELAEGPVTQVWGQIAEDYNEYWYTTVTPQEAAFELGFNTASNAEARMLLIGLLPRLKPDAIGISPEDAILGALKRGEEITRLQWELVSADASFRTLDTLRAADAARQAQAAPRGGGRDETSIVNPVSGGGVRRLLPAFGGSR